MTVAISSWSRRGSIARARTCTGVRPSWSILHLTYDRTGTGMPVLVNRSTRMPPSAWCRVEAGVGAQCLVCVDLEVAAVLKKQHMAFLKKHMGS